MTEKTFTITDQKVDEYLSTHYYKAVLDDPRLYKLAFEAAKASFEEQGFVETVCLDDNICMSELNGLSDAM